MTVGNWRRGWFTFIIRRNRHCASIQRCGRHPDGQIAADHGLPAAGPLFLPAQPRPTWPTRPSLGATTPACQSRSSSSGNCATSSQRVHRHINGSFARFAAAASVASPALRNWATTLGDHNKCRSWALAERRVLTARIHCGRLMQRNAAEK